MGKVGPHEGREFALFATGEKHLILFFSDGLPDNVLPLAQSVGALEWVFNAGKLFPDSEIELIGYIYYRDGYQEQAAHLASLVLATLNKSANPIQLERDIGRLLGYSEADIDAYIKSLTSRRAKLTTRLHDEY